MFKHIRATIPVKKAILFLSLFLISLFLVSRFTSFVEICYSQMLYSVSSIIQRVVFGFLPFSAGDFGYLALIVFILYGFVTFIAALVKGNISKTGYQLLRGFMYFELLLVLFYSLWGMNYYRAPAAQLLNLQDTSYTLKDVENTSIALIDSLNYCRAVLTNKDYSIENHQIFSSSSKAVQALSTYNKFAAGWRPGAKASLFTPLLNYMGTSGYTNPFTGEAQVNTQMPIFDRPVTACHEMAHQLGFAREDEANFIGFLAGSKSSDRLQRYSAYYLAVEEFLFFMRRRDTLVHHQLRALLSPAVKADFRTDSIYWTHYEGKFGLITGKFYNQFLKANNQPAGLHTYNRMIVLTMAYYKKKHLRASVPSIVSSVSK